MKKLLMIAAAVVLSAAVGAGVAVAAVGTGPAERLPNPPVSSGPTEGVTAAEAPTTRVAVWVNGGVNEGEYTVVRGKGVSAVTNPDPGLFCIRPNVSGLHPSRVIPMVSVEWSLSTANDAAAQWRSVRSLCPAGTLEFLTFNATTGVPNQDTSFTVVIP